jgi:release factor glutamine methyltransferase
MKFSNLQRNKIIKQINGFKKARKFNFGGIELLLNKYTLIPHPDTFQLIKLAEEILKKDNQLNTIADIGTGSGIIAIHLAKKFPSKIFLASDICKEALILARKNSVLNKIKNIKFFHNNDKVWLSEYKNTKIDFIISNPPFVGEKEFNDTNFQITYPEIKMEPANAIVTHGDTHGLSPYLEIIKNSKKTQTKLFLFQCNSENIESLVTKIKKAIKCKINVVKDDSSLKRFLLIKTLIW